MRSGRWAQERVRWLRDLSHEVVEQTLVRLGGVHVNLRERNPENMSIPPLWEKIGAMEEQEMDKKEFLKLAGKVWEECERAVDKATSGQVMRETEGVFREKFLELARRAAEGQYQRRADGHAFSPSVRMRQNAAGQRGKEEGGSDDSE